MWFNSYEPSDYSLISLPGLGITIDPDRSFSVFGWDVHYYAVIIAVGLFLAVVYGLRRKNQFGLSEDNILDGVLWIVPFAVICARAYYCIFTWEEYAPNPISVLYIWKGGLAIYGGVIGAVIGVIVFCKVKKISIGATLDLVALGFLIGQAIGRWGNFINREAFGAEVSQDFFLAMGLYNTDLGQFQYFHPTFLYESLWNIVGFVALHFLSKKRQYDGQIALGYVAWYGLGRALIEGLRTDSLWLGPFRVSQLLAAVSCLAATGVLVFMVFRKHSPDKLFVNQVAMAQVESQGEENTEE